MNCPYCGGKSGVLDSRYTRGGQYKWRRRRCQVCGRTFPTWESYNGPAKHEDSSYQSYLDMIKSLKNKTPEQERNSYTAFISLCLAKIADNLDRRAKDE